MGAIEPFKIYFIKFYPLFFTGKVCYNFKWAVAISLDNTKPCNRRFFDCILGRIMLLFHTLSATYPVAGV